MDRDRTGSSSPSASRVRSRSRCSIDTRSDPRCAGSVYDRMDRFAAFHSGVSRSRCSVGRSKSSARSITCRRLPHPCSWRPSRLPQRRTLCLNGFDEAAMPRRSRSLQPAGHAALGYVGTLGTWFDWDWLERLAEQLDAEGSSLTIRLIGPCFRRPSRAFRTGVDGTGPATRPRAARHAGAESRSHSLQGRRADGGRRPDQVLRVPRRRACRSSRRRSASCVTGPRILACSSLRQRIRSQPCALRLRTRRDGPRCCSGDCTWRARFAPLVEWLQVACGRMTDRAARLEAPAFDSNQPKNELEETACARVTAQTESPVAAAALQRSPVPEVGSGVGEGAPTDCPGAQYPIR